MPIFHPPDDRRVANTFLSLAYPVRKLANAGEDNFFLFFNSIGCVVKVFFAIFLHFLLDGGGAFA